MNGTTPVPAYRGRPLVDRKKLSNISHLINDILKYSNLPRTEIEKIVDLFIKSLKERLCKYPNRSVILMGFGTFYSKKPKSQKRFNTKNKSIEVQEGKWRVKFVPSPTLLEDIRKRLK